MHKKWLPQLLLGALLYLSSASTSCLAEVCSISQDGDLSSRAISLFEAGRLNDAMVLAQQGVHQSPNKWQSHAVLGYLSWKQGDVVQALSETEKAIELDPSNPKLLENFAEMNEILGDFSTAASIYKQMQSASNTCAAGLGLARCNAKSPDRKVDALSTLAEMTARRGKETSWYLQIADTYLQLGEAKMAWQAAEKASRHSKNLEQRRQSRALLLLALLKDNQTKQANNLRDFVFNHCDSKTCELFVLAAQKLLSPNDVQQARRILDSALKNLSTEDDADAFYRVGRVFQDNASKCTEQRQRYDDWTVLASTAYARAAELEPQQGRYHLALAGTLARLGRLEQFLHELSKAKDLDPFDSLAPFLLSHIPVSGNLKPASSDQLDLHKVTFKLKGVNCSCHLSKVEKTLASYDSVAFACIKRPEYNGNPFNSDSQNKAQEYEGTLFVCSPAKDIRQIFSRCSKEFFSQANQKNTFEFDFVGMGPLKDIDEAVRTAQDCKYPDPGQFVNQIRVVEPTLPLELVTQAHATQTKVSGKSASGQF